MKSKTQLGRGMAALLKNKPPVIEEKTNKLDTQKPYMMSIQSLRANKDQPRRIFKEEDLKELAASIKENGIIQPILVAQKEDGHFEIIAGERRYRASKMVGLEQVPVIIKRVTKKDSMVMAILENIQRSDLNPVEEALAYFQLMNEFSLTQEEVAKRLGKERSSIANYLRILKLPKEVLTLVQRELISLGHAKVLVSLKDEGKIKSLAKVVADEKISVRELEKLAKKNKTKSSVVKTKKVDAAYTGLRNKLEQKTGFHLNIKSKKNGSGELVIKFANDKELGNIYEYLMN